MTLDVLPTIFVVDDEQVIAQTLAIILRRKGFLTQPFYDPLDALAAAQIAPPDILLSDVIMPQMTGINLAISFRKLYPRCGVILFSGQAETEDLLTDAHNLGYDFLLLSKPVHPSELLRHIREQLLATPVIAEQASPQTVLS